MFKAVVFDLDGTIVDTIPDVTDCVNYALKDNNVPYVYSKNEIVSFFGKGSDVLLKLALKDKANDSDLFNNVKTAYLKQYQSKFCVNSKAFDGIADVLRSFKKQGLLLFVFTNKPTSIAIPLLEQLFGNGMFDGIIGNDFVFPPKPFALPMERMLKEFGLAPKDILYVGDSEVDLLTAKNLKAKVALCTYGYGDYLKSFVKEADYIIKSPKDLLFIL